MPTLVDVPFYEPVIMGSPLYIWIMSILAFLLVMGAFGVYSEIYMRMREVWGFRDASASGKPMAIIRGSAGKILFETVDYVANVFKAINLPLSWIVTAPVSGQLGKVNVIDVSDDWNIVTNVDIGWAIQYSAESWNLRQIEQNKELEHPLPIEDLPLIIDWQTYQLHLMNGDLERMFPQGVILPPFRIIDFTEQRRYLPRWSASHFAGFINREVERRLEQLKATTDVEGAKRVMMYLMAGGGVFLVCCALGYLILRMAETGGVAI